MAEDRAFCRFPQLQVRSQVLGIPAQARNYAERDFCPFTKRSTRTDHHEQKSASLYVVRPCQGTD